MKKLLLGILCLGASLAANAQKSEITEAEKSWNLYQGLGQKQELSKQIEALNKGLEHTDKAIANEKSKVLPKAWSVRALLASQISYIDTLNNENAMAKEKIAIEAIEKAKSLDTKGEEKENITNSETNLAYGLQNRAIRAYHKKDYEGALNGFNAILAQKPNDTSMYINAGVTAKLLKKYPEAIQHFKKAASFNTKDAKSFYTEIISMQLAELKDTTAALTQLDEAIAKFPEDPDLIGIQTDIYITKGDIEKSQNSLTKLLATDPNKPVYNFLLGNTYFLQAQAIEKKRNKLDQKKQAKAFADETVKLNSLIDKSVPYYKKALETDPKYVPALESLKVIYGFKNDTKNYEDITSRLKAAQEASPKN